MWMSPRDVDLPSVPPRRVARVGGWSPEADPKAQLEVTIVAVVMSAAVIFFGIVPSPLFDLAKDVGSALSGVF
jgi:NADH-quinone oxidoreductase subunit N